jgi:exopolysaccharide production protein ExoZ
VFIPDSGYEGSWAPILPQGWTLNYEMMFYVIFALGLSFRRQIALPAVGVMLGVFVVVGPLLPNETLVYLASPIVLCFCWAWGAGPGPVPGMGLERFPPIMKHIRRCGSSLRTHWVGMRQAGWRCGSIDRRPNALQLFAAMP